MGSYRVSRLALLALAVAALGGCARDVTSPGATTAPRLAQVPVVAGQTYIAAVAGNMAKFQQRVADLGGTVSYVHAGAGIAFVSGLDASSAAALNGSGLVNALQPNQQIRLEKPAYSAPMQARPASPSSPAGAAFYASQWNLRAIRADQAWAAGKLGSSQVTVAIIDSGIDYTYPDLVGRVDLSRSKSFLAVDNDSVAYYFPGANPIADLYFHGTHVAATVASNAYLAAGVTSRATLIGFKVCSYLGGCPDTAIIRGLMAAADARADVANLSLGGPLLKRNGGGAYAAIYNQVFNYVARRGMTTVVAAGNDHMDLDHELYLGDRFPSLHSDFCSNSGVICVAATGPSSSGDFWNGPFYNVDAPAFYSNYGRSVIDVAAPGGNSGGGVIAGCSTFILVYSCSPVPAPGGGYFYYLLSAEGTSMAAPHVSALAALLVERYGRNPARIRTAIEQSADDLGQPGVDPFYGAGRINVAKALGL